MLASREQVSRTKSAVSPLPPMGHGETRPPTVFNPLWARMALRVQPKLAADAPADRLNGGTDQAPAIQAGGATPVVQRKEDPTCSIHGPLWGYENIRNVSRARLVARGFVFCGPDSDPNPRDSDLWERWVHPTQGVMHYQVRWRDDPPPDDPPPDDREQRCAAPCTDSTDDKESCKECCEDSIAADDKKCLKTCNTACDLAHSLD